MGMTFARIRNFLYIFRRRMTSSTNLLTPVGVRGMKSLDRAKFLRNIQVPVLKVTDQKISDIIQLCKRYFLKLENFKPVQVHKDDNNEPLKYIHLNPEKVSQWLDFSKDERETLSQYGITETNFDIREIQLTYDNWRLETIFKAVLPENEEIVSGFSTIGHIVHVNLREHLLDYRSLIGQVLLDKIKTCRTVVNKSNIIDNTYRNFSMEVIAGEENFTVTVKENNCSFYFDFSKVYWNPRLCKEHERILHLLKPGDILFDVFCGVGPFAIPAAKKTCRVFANDLNPDSFKWLNHNAKINKIKTDLFQSYNFDGKDFICDIFKDYLIKYFEGKVTIDDHAKIHITMNLPAMAVEFLKYFKGLFDTNEFIEKFNCEIIVYVYCFAVGDDPVAVAKEMVNSHFGCDISSNILDIFDVRNVSPKKEMMRVTIKLTKDLLFNVKSGSNKDGEPPHKKLCITNEK